MRKVRRLPFPLLFAATALMLGAARARAEPSIIECSGIQRAVDRATNVKLPATLYTRKFAFDEGARSLLEYVNQKWIVLDAAAEVDKTDISARYSRDYPEGRIDIIFEFNRVSNSLIYILDVDEKPGEFFNAHCQVGAAKSN